MSCDKCDGLKQTFEIRTPKDFQKVLRVIRANLEDGTIESLPAAAGSVIPTIDLGSLSEAGPWPDVLEETFGCRGCGQRFRLDVETYHGAGGAWRAERSRVRAFRWLWRAVSDTSDLMEMVFLLVLTIALLVGAVVFITQRCS
jgi:hypothetical protein